MAARQGHHPARRARFRRLIPEIDPFWASILTIISVLLIIAILTLWK
jgi:hypothetical protein